MNALLNVDICAWRPVPDPQIGIVTIQVASVIGNIHLELAILVLTRAPSNCIRADAAVLCQHEGIIVEFLALLPLSGAHGVSQFINFEGTFSDVVDANLEYCESLHKVRQWI